MRCLHHKPRAFGLSPTLRFPGSKAILAGVLFSLALTTAVPSWESVSAASTTTPPQTLPTNLPMQPLLYPQATDGGYLVTCNLNDPTTNCGHLLGMEPGAAPVGAGSAIATFLVNVPADFQYISNWIPYTSSGPVQTSTPSDPTYQVTGTSGTGSTAGTAIEVGAIYPSESSVVAPDWTNDAAAIDGYGQSDRCGLHFGEVGSDFYDYSMPYVWYGGGGHPVPAVELSAGDIYTAEMGNVNTSQPYCTIMNTSTESEVFSVELSSSYSEQGTGGRTNRVYSRLGTAATPVIDSNEGWQTVAYFETDLGVYKAWSEVSLENDSPYVGVLTNVPEAFCMMQLFTGENSCLEV